MTLAHKNDQENIFACPYLQMHITFHLVRFVLKQHLYVHNLHMHLGSLQFVFKFVVLSSEFKVYVLDYLNYACIKI